MSLRLSEVVRVKGSRIDGSSVDDVISIKVGVPEKFSSRSYGNVFLFQLLEQHPMQLYDFGLEIFLDGNVDKPNSCHLLLAGLK